MRAACLCISFAFVVLTTTACRDGSGRMLPPNPDAGPGTSDGGGGDSGPATHCGNGLRDGDETHLDCGGSCMPCMAGQGCARPSDCLSSVCSGGFCLMPACDDGVLNGAETDIDCGGGTCSACTAGMMCVNHTDCDSGLCDTMAGTCASTSCTDGTINADETDVDCGGSCPGCAGGLTCAVDEDCLSLICMAGSCTTAICTDRTQNGMETDVDCGGPDCPGCRDGSMCAMDSDCESTRCISNMCVSCMDGRINGDETGVDCGGPTCPGCPDGEFCNVGTDCMNGICTMMMCAAPACDDMVLNGMETDVDCGGPDCTGCATGAMCAAAGDCADGVCDMTAMTCSAPSCTDGVANGMETDVDCGGPRGGGGCPRCADFRRCTSPTDCMTAMCTMGFCGATGCMPFPGTSRDTFGNFGCTVPMTPSTLPCPDISTTGTSAALTDDSNRNVPIGFSFSFYGTSYTTADIQSNGGLTFTPGYMTLGNACLPTTSGRPPQILTMWDDLNPSVSGSSVRYETRGTAPNRQFVVAWDTARFGAGSGRARFTLVLKEGANDIDVCYYDTDFGNATYDRGASATIGIDRDATDALQFSCNMPNVPDGLLVRYISP